MPRTAQLRTRRTRIARHIGTHIAAAAFYCGVWVAFAYCLTTTLDEMTRRDCRAGSHAACEALQR